MFTVGDATQPVVLVACGSFSPVTNLHLRMFEMAKDYLSSHPSFELLGGYFSPVSDEYNKPGLVSWHHRVEMLRKATKESHWLEVDEWEARGPYRRTLWVLEHFERMLNRDLEAASYLLVGRRRIKPMLLAGSDLIQSFAVPNLWREKDLQRIVGDYGCVIIERPGSDVSDYLIQSDVLWNHRKNVHTVRQHIQNDISSTKIRLFISRGLSIRYLLPDAVVKYIETHGLYRREVEKTPKIGHKRTHEEETETAKKRRQS
ncbi:hypothetical protein BC832DRAFT_526943 [Gaertneriomyces semiglobifer]|nr:hypothetical protein BC832DRAFT_526943 [Gaertneriomyces semiglobifer]